LDIPGRNDIGFTEVVLVDVAMGGRTVDVPVLVLMVEAVVVVVDAKDRIGRLSNIDVAK
jgi:hypothetical protein